MSLKVLVEPSRFIFDICKKDYDAEIERFDRFYENLLELAEKMQNEKLYIAVSEDLYDIFEDSFPANAYDSYKYPKAKQVAQAFGTKLKKLFKRPHSSYGDHGLDTDFVDGCVDKTNELFGASAYIAFRDLAGYVLKGSLPNAVLKSDEESIFLKTYAEIEEKNKHLRKTMDVCSSVDGLMNSECIKRIVNIKELFKSIDEEDVEINKVPCASTSTHDSMWGIKIRHLNDVPEPERDLLKLMITTGMVNDITFLDFNDIKSGVHEEPVIAIRSIASKSNADILECILYGKGDKNNCQRLNIEVIKGKGHILAELVDNELAEKSLRELILHTRI